MLEIPPQNWYISGMNKFIRTLALALVAICGLPVLAQEESSTESLALVPQALQDAKYVNKAKPNLKAKLYFIYQSRSTCGICVAEAPTLVKEYRKMKARGCEMVMLNVDRSPEDAEKWAKKAKMTFPVMSPTMSMSSGIPWTYSGKPLLPCMIAVTPDGTKIAEAGGPDVSDFVKGWKKLLRDIEKEEAKKNAAEKKKKASSKKNRKRKSDDETDEDEES